MARTPLSEMVAAAKAAIEELSVEQLQAEIDADDVTVVDIRDVRERWDKGAIPGAKSMPRGMLEFWFDPESPYYRDGVHFDQRYVFYCAGGQRSALAAKVVQDLGYENVDVRIGDGFEGWPEHAPYDGILTAAAPAETPQALLDQLAAGGRLVLPLGRGQQQRLTVLRRVDDGVEQHALTTVNFVPLVTGVN